MLVFVVARVRVEQRGAVLYRRAPNDFFAPIPDGHQQHEASFVDERQEVDQDLTAVDSETTLPEVVVLEASLRLAAHRE